MILTTHGAGSRRRAGPMTRREARKIVCRALAATIRQRALGCRKRVEDLTDGRPYGLDAIYPIGHNETFYDLIDASSKRERWGAIDEETDLRRADCGCSRWCRESGRPPDRQARRG